MKRRHGPLRLAHGPPTLFSSIMLAATLSICQPLARADTAPVSIGGPYTLMAPDGTTVTDETYRGKWLLVFFGYTSCPDICPTTLYEIAAAIEELGPDAAKLQPIFITVDPERDTPEVMGKYAGAFHPRIVGLTGSPQQIAAVAREYGAYSALHKTGAGAEGYSVDHSTYIYIMDPQGKFVRGLDVDTPTGRIADTLRKLMAQSHE
jgi:protein SCO1/2